MALKEFTGGDDPVDVIALGSMVVSTEADRGDLAGENSFATARKATSATWAQPPS